MSLSLKKRKDFDNVYKNGKVFGNRNFTLRYVETRKDANRLGIVVSKRVSKKAVVRNKIRRQVKEAYRKLDPAVKQGYDLLFIAKPSCSHEPYSVLEGSIGHLLRKEGLLEKKGRP